VSVTWYLGLAWLRALGATGEYYAQHMLSEMYLVGCCESARVGLPRTRRQQGPVPARHAWLGPQVVVRSGDLHTATKRPPTVSPRAGPGGAWTCSPAAAAAAPRPTATLGRDPFHWSRKAEEMIEIYIYLYIC